VNKRLYTGFSFFQFIWMIILRLAATFGLLYSIKSIDENPIVITLVAIFCLLIILFIGEDEIIVYPDRVTQTTNSLASIFIKTPDCSYKIQDIKSAYLQPIGSTAEFGVAILLVSLLPKGNTHNKDIRPIFLELKNGKTVTIETYLEWVKMKKIVDIINSLVN
jgi:hypothetical protein